jgi:hypothetical protein
MEFKYYIPRPESSRAVVLKEEDFEDIRDLFANDQVTTVTLDNGVWSFDCADGPGAQWTQNTNEIALCSKTFQNANWPTWMGPRFQEVPQADTKYTVTEL